MLPEVRKALSGDCLLKGFHLENGGRISLRHSQLCRYVQAFGIRAGAEKSQTLSAAVPKPLRPIPLQHGCAPGAPSGGHTGRSIPVRA